MNEQKAAGLTVVILTENDQYNIGQTILALKQQTIPPAEIVVLENNSMDETAEVARNWDATVIELSRHAHNLVDLKNMALSGVETEYCMIIRSGVILDHKCVEEMLHLLKPEKIAAAYGCMQGGPKLEYLPSNSFFTIYKTEIIKKLGGWRERTKAEDIDLAWTLYHEGWKISFVPKAKGYLINQNIVDYRIKQIAHGLAQNIKIHRLKIPQTKQIKKITREVWWEAAAVPAIYLLILPGLILISHNPVFILGYAADAPLSLWPEMRINYKKRGVWKMVAAIPGFFVRRTIKGLYLLEAMITENILRPKISSRY